MKEYVFIGSHYIRPRKVEIMNINTPIDKVDKDKVV